MAFRNKFAVSCAICRENVPTGTGWTEGPPWVTRCQKCSGLAPTTKVLVRMAGADFSFTLTGARLDPERFQEYRHATAGSAFDSKSNVAPPARAAIIVQALQAAKFILEVEPEAAALLQARISEMRSVVESAGARADQFDAMLRKRGQALFPFQKVGVAWLASRLSGLLGDEMGLGKTLQALAALPEGVPVIVVCPAVAKGVWKREAAKWRPEFKVILCEGRGSFQVPKKGEIVVVNYDILPALDLPTLATKSCSNVQGFKRTCVVRSTSAGSTPCEACKAWEAFKSQFAEGTVLIADEAHVLANSKTIRTTRFRNLSKVARQVSGRVWLLTATPLMNKQPELWSIFQAAGLANEAFGSWENFVPHFGGSYTGWEGSLVWGTPDPAVCGPMIAKVSLRRLRSEVLPELPGKMYQEHIVPINASSRKICDKTMKFFDDYTRFSRVLDDPKPESEVSNDIERAVESLRTKNSRNFEQLSGAREALATAKIPSLLEMVEDFEAQGEPVVVFSAHRKPIDIFRNREGWAVITGDTPAKTRTEIEDAFQRGELKGIAGTIKAAGVSITLTRAAHAIFVDLEWTPTLNAQAEDRLSRIGQFRGVVIHLLIAEHPLDQRVFELLTTKQSIIAATVDASRQKPGEVVEIKTFEVNFQDLELAAKAELEAQARAEAEAEVRRQEMGAKFGGPETPQEGRTRRRHERWTHEAKADTSLRTTPQTAREVWVAAALATLAQLDPDRAAVRNDAGFSASDGGIGHKMAYLAGKVGLTSEQWGFAKALCSKYRRQVGVMPEE